MKSRFLRAACVPLFAGLLGLALTPSVPAFAAGAPAAADVKKKVPYSQYVHTRTAAILDALQADGNYPEAIKSLRAQFDQVILYGTDDRLDAVREADFALRLVTHLEHVAPATRNELLPYLRKNENLAGTLVFLIRPDREKPAEVYALLDKMRQKRGEQLDKYATLASAICVIHNRPFQRHINENAVKSIDPIDLFDYYVKNESRMFFGIRNVPAELLLYVVDTTATVEEMTWALGKYGGDREVGRRFFDIKYDYEHLKTGREKEVTAKGYNLPNILKYGGVCADQAYFAMTVGKSIGVPTAYDTGSSGTVGHAWVGFLQSNGKNGWWNFDSGRYEAYQGVRGNVLDPQTRENVPDSYVSLLGEMIATKAVDRQNAVALTDAAARLIALDGNAAAGDVTAPPADEIVASSLRAKPRPTDVVAQQGLIELALRQSAAYAPAWFTIRDLAVAKKLSLTDKRRWADILLRLGAQKYPDFTLAMLMPMVQTIEDPKEQDTLWNKVFPLFQTRFDLAASIRMAQASLWETQNQTDRAGLCYMDVVEHYTNGGPFVLNALVGAEKLLKSSNRADKVVLLYEQTWTKTKQPKEMAPEFMTQSNWYRIGKMYAAKLTESGNRAKAAEVEAKIGATPKAAS